MRDFLASTGPGRGIWTSRRGRWGLAILLPSRARPQYSIYGIFSSSDCSREVNSNGHHMGRRSVWGQQEGELPRRASVEGGCPPPALFSGRTLTVFRFALLPVSEKYECAKPALENKFSGVF